MTTSLPTLKDELDRKALEALQWLVVQNEQGRIWDQSLYVARMAMFNTVSGLVDSDISRLTHSNPPAETSGEIKAVLHKQGKTVVLRRSARMNIASVTIIGQGNKGQRAEKLFEGDTGPVRANEWIQKMKETLVKNQGFVEI